MKCLASFKCNGVRGVPGKSLTSEELELIGEWLPSLLSSGLVEELENEVQLLDEAIEKADKRAKKKSKKGA